MAVDERYDRRVKYFGGILNEETLQKGTSKFKVDKEETDYIIKEIMAEYKIKADNLEGVSDDGAFV